jgi:hypothetical protein
MERVHGHLAPPWAATDDVETLHAVFMELALQHLPASPPHEVGVEVHQDLGPRPRPTLLEDRNDLVPWQSGAAWVYKQKQAGTGRVTQHLIEVVPALAAPGLDV